MDVQMKLMIFAISMLVIFWIIQKGMTHLALALKQRRERRPMVQLTPRQIRRSAAHEAGHAVVALVLVPDWLREAVIVTEVPMEVDEDHLGAHVRYQYMSSELTCKQSLAVLVVRYGGLVAEQQVMGDYGRGVIGDLKQAALAAGEHVDLFGMHDKPPIFYEAIVQGVRLQHAERERQLWEEIEKLLAAAHTEATALVNEHSPLLHRIMEALLEKHRLSREELLALREAYEAERRSASAG